MLTKREQNEALWATPGIPYTPIGICKDVIDCLLFRYSHTLGTLWPICIRFTLLLLYGTYGTIRDIWGVFLYFVIH